jgi:hypothetical protein
MSTTVATPARSTHVLRRVVDQLIAGLALSSGIAIAAEHARLRRDESRATSRFSEPRCDAGRRGGRRREGRPRAALLGADDAEAAVRLEDHSSDERG